MAITQEQKFKKLLDAMDEETLTKEDFLKSFEKVVEFAQKLEREMLQAIEKLGEAIKLAKVTAEKNASESLGITKKELTERVEQILKEQKTNLDLIHSKVGKLRDGKDADEQRVIDSVLEQLHNNYIRTPEQVRDKLETLQGEERLDISAIKGFKELKQELEEKIKTPKVQGGGMIGRDWIKDIDISGDLDGSTKTFNIPAVWNIISVHLSSYPHALRKTVDFTYTPTTITFTSEIDAASSLAAGQTCVLTVVTG